jgi:hypothetical protein
LTLLWKTLFKLNDYIKWQGLAGGAATIVLIVVAAPAIILVMRRDEASPARKPMWMQRVCHRRAQIAGRSCGGSRNTRNGGP